MSIKLHHATVKSAITHGLVARLHKDGDEVEILRQGSTIATHASGSIALKQALGWLAENATEGGKIDPLLNGSGAATKKPSVASEKESAKTKTAKKLAKKVKKSSAIEQMDEDGEVNEDEEGKSIIKRAYKKLYKPHHNTNGDELANLIREYLVVNVKMDGKTAKRIDAVKLRRFAKANDCWVAGYENLNVGQIRMNVGNRLRAKVAKGFEVRWV